MTASQHPERRIPYVLTEAGRRITEEMLKESRARVVLLATRRDRRWALTDAAIALLDSEDT